jgi:hypothetical protein
VSEKFVELLPDVAVINAVVIVLTDDVFTVKFLLDEPAAMLTDVGTVAAVEPLDRSMVMVLEAAPLSVNVQVDVAGGVTLPGLQLKEDKVGVTGWLMVTVPPPPVRLRAFALPSDANALTSETSVELSVVPAAI